MKAICPALLAFSVLVSQIGCDGSFSDQGHEGFDSLTQEIRNGTREPTLVSLSEGQKLAIGWLHQPGNPGGNFCTGTLISPRVVATASHCTEGKRASGISFGVGLRPANSRATFQVAQIHEHPNVDAALLILQEDVTSRVPEIVPIVANTASIPNSQLGNTVEASGYGETYDNSRDGRWFAALELESIGNSYVVVNGNGQRGICFGDSGGPLLSTLSGSAPVLLAVESNGDASCLGRDNMTRLDAIASWMTSVAGDLPTTDDNSNMGGGDPCAGLDYRGRCNGDVAEWCQNAQLESLNCAAQNQACGYVNDDVGYYCVDSAVDEPVDNTDPAPDPTETCDSGDNLCDDQVRYVCVSGDLVIENCADIGAICAFSDNGEPICLVPGDDTEDLPPGRMDNDTRASEDSGSDDEGGFVGGGSDSNTGWADSPESNAWSDEGDQDSSGDIMVNEGCSVSPLASRPRAPHSLLALALGGLVVLMRRR